MQYLATNFAYGTGPYLRTTELALAFNKELEKAGRARLGIIVPLVYGEKQKRIMLEEFAPQSPEIFLDEELGKILKSVFYGENSYEEALEKWTQNAKILSAKAQKHLLGKFKTVSLSGVEKEIDGHDIVLEISRSPRLRYDVAPAYFTTFGYIADILTEAQKVPEEKISVRKDLLLKGAETAQWVESAAKIHAIANPATFSWDEAYNPRYKTEILAPPISRLYPADYSELAPGFFVTITGIPGLERLYEDARRLGLKLYSNDIEAVPGSIRVLPHAIPNKNIFFQFARSGWGSVWLSMISGTPLVVPEFDPKDDPEIYFNNLAVENLGIGIIYRGQKLEEILEKTNELKTNSLKLCDKILARCKTLDGNEFCAKIFVKDYLS